MVLDSLRRVYQRFSKPSLPEYVPPPPTAEDRMRPFHISLIVIDIDSGLG